jgi:phosphonate transport system permease protein
MTPRRFPLGARAGVLLAITCAGAAAYAALGLSPGQLMPQRGGLEIVRRFFARALTPALTYESSFVPEGTAPLAVKVGGAALKTVAFAAAAMSLALVIGLALALPASSAWWEGERRSPFAVVLWGATRALIGFMRSIHELLWAVLLLAAFGLTPFAGVLAIAIPYGGTLAKIFSEMIDEAPRASGFALRAAGSSPSQVFFFGLLPRALPDMGAYAFYRFECAVRTSAVLGFFGFETLGYFIRASFDNVHYGETWTYLYALLLLVIAIDAWSGALRRRFVA